MPIELTSIDGSQPAREYYAPPPARTPLPHENQAVNVSSYYAPSSGALLPQGPQPVHSGSPSEGQYSYVGEARNVIPQTSLHPYGETGRVHWVRRHPREARWFCCGICILCIIIPIVVFIAVAATRRKTERTYVTNGKH